MSFSLTAALLGLVSVGVDAFCWGMAAQLLYRRWFGTRRRWWLAALASAALFLAWDELLFGQVVAQVAFLGGSASLSGELPRLATSVALTGLGFWAGRALLDRVVERSGGSLRECAGPGAAEALPRRTPAA